MDDEAFALLIGRWKLDPVKFVRDNFGVEPDWWQREALEALANPDGDRRIACQACAGPGKSAFMAWGGWWFLTCQGDKNAHPKGLVTSVSKPNLKDNLWSELTAWYNRSPFMQQWFVVTKERIVSKDHEDWFLSARTYSKSANPEEQGRTLSGTHAPYILYLIDESGDIGVSVLNSAEQGMSNCRWGKILTSGNPTSSKGILYYCATKASSRWKIIRITGDPDDPKRSPRIDAEWAREMIAEHGRDDPWVMAYILGLFPPTGINQLFGPDQVREAQERHLREDEYKYLQRRLGIDVASYGDDSTVIFPRQGLAAFNYVALHSQDSAQVAARVLRAADAFKSELEIIDITGGWGGGVIDQLRLVGRPVVGVNFSSKAVQHSRYHNKRAEMYFEMRDWLKRGGALPPCGLLAEELTGITYTMKAGRMILEDKALMKKVMKRSPDRADALALTFAIPEIAGPDAPPMKGRDAGRMEVTDTVIE